MLHFNYVRNARMSPCGRYRYLLTRQWRSGPVLPIIMLNPSTADAQSNDPTIHQCISHAANNAFVGITVANLYAYRSSNPSELNNTVDPVGPENDATLKALIKVSTECKIPIVLAWGIGKGVSKIDDRIDRVKRYLRVAGADARCLGVNKNGSPKHPLWIKGKVDLIPFAL